MNDGGRTHSQVQPGVDWQGWASEAVSGSPVCVPLVVLPAGSLPRAGHIHTDRSQDTQGCQVPAQTPTISWEDSK
jgi:hypothetical protein